MRTAEKVCTFCSQNYSYGTHKSLNIACLIKRNKAVGQALLSQTYSMSKMIFLCDVSYEGLEKLLNNLVIFIKVKTLFVL